MKIKNSKVEKIAYFTKGEIVTPLTQLRIVGPLHFENIEIQADLRIEDLNEDAFNNIDLIVLQRDFPDDLAFFKKILKFARTLEIPVIFDLDDNLLALPENHPDRLSHHFASSLLPIYESLLLVDFVTVSTEKLKQTFKSFNENIYVLPNYLDDSLWPFHLPIRQNKTKSITIGYMGGESHKPDIEWITPILEKINQKFNGEINFHFYGVQPPKAFLNLNNVKYTELKTYHYKEFIDDFHHIDVDIVIAPLVDNLFNHCKSPLKFFEYSTMGVPGVFSDIEPYKNVIIDGENGFLAKSEDEWFEKLETLIQNPDLRYKLAKNAQETVRANWLMSENARLWTDTYNKFIQMGPQRTRNNAAAEIIDSISSQLHEFHYHQNNIIAKKNLVNKALEEKEVLIQTQNEQLSEQKRLIQSISDELQKQEQVSQNLQNKVAEKEISNKSLSNKLSEKEGLIQSLNEKLSSKEKELSSFSSQLTEKQQTIDSLKSEIKNNSKDLTTYDSQLTEKIKIIENLELQINDLQEKFSSKNSQINQQNQIVTKLEEQINNQKLEVDSFKEKLSKMEEEVLFYSLSKSWRFTRPIRNFKKLFKGGKND